MSSKMLEMLLRSSVPLEQETAEIVFNNDFYLFGEFPYLRKSETGLETEFSVDIRAEKWIDASNRKDVSVVINSLIECKYSSQSVEWVFSGAPDLGPMESSLAPHFSWLGEYLILNTDNQLDELFPSNFCNKGLSLSPTNADPTPIKHGLQQLRYAIPHLLDVITTSNIEHARFMGSRREKFASPVIAPMLVTNAPIRVLNRGIDLKKTNSARSLDDISTINKMICTYQPAGPELLDNCRKMADKISKKYEGNGRTSSKAIFDDLVIAVESIPVISLDYLSAHLTNLENIFSSLKLESRYEWSKRVHEAFAPSD